jgi:hypothetical protein
VPPIVTANLHTAWKALDYDPLTGTGDNSFTTYNGGACSGAVFNSAGATEVASGYDHFVVTENGSRFDGIATLITNPTNSIAGFFLFGHRSKTTLNIGPRNRGAR